MRAQWRIATTLTGCDSELLGETTDIEFALLHTNNPVRIAFHEWEDLWRDVREAPDLRGWVFGRPSWQHDAASRLAGKIPAGDLSASR